MPAGNDATEAARELLAATGGVGGNAEELIQAIARAYPKELKATLTKKYDASATQVLDRDAVSKKVDGRVLDYAVRGDNVVVVAEAKDGRTFKVAIALDDLGRAGRAALEAADDEQPEQPEADDSADDDGDKDSGKPAARAARGHRSSSARS